MAVVRMRTANTMAMSTFISESSPVGVDTTTSELLELVWSVTVGDEMLNNNVTLLLLNSSPEFNKVNIVDVVEVVVSDDQFMVALFFSSWSPTT